MPTQLCMCSGSFLQGEARQPATVQCGSSATQEWTDCASVFEKQVRMPLMAELGDGQGSDGQAGSLCTLAGTLRMLGCASPLACVPLIFL